MYVYNYAYKRIYLYDTNTNISICISISFIMSIIIMITIIIIIIIIMIIIIIIIISSSSSINKTAEVLVQPAAPDALAVAVLDERLAEQDVLPDRGVEDPRLLRREGDRPPPPHLGAAGRRPGRQRHLAEDRLQQRGLPARRGPDDPDQRPLGEVQAQLLQPEALRAGRRGGRRRVGRRLRLRARRRRRLRLLLPLYYIMLHYSIV